MGGRKRPVTQSFLQYLKELGLRKENTHSYKGPSGMA